MASVQTSSRVVVLRTKILYKKIIPIEKEMLILKTTKNKGSFIVENYNELKFVLDWNEKIRRI